MIIVGYGDFKDYRIEEIPDAFLAELAARYKLSHSAHSRSSQEELQITIAVHEELQRRSNGHKAMKKHPSARELGRKLVTKGFQQLSLDCHPDRGGTNTAQARLNRVRQSLLEACAEIPDDEWDDALVIPQPKSHEFVGTEITDDDIPF
jgi:hypothetical protein